MRLRHWVASLALAFLGGGVLPDPCPAQQRPQVIRRPAELLAGYVKESGASGLPNGAGSEIVRILVNTAAYPPADVLELLGGLEQLAIGGSPPRLRAEAAAYIGLSGSHRSTAPRPGTVARLVRVYRRSDDPLVRSLTISAMGEQVLDRSVAISFLEETAAQRNGDSSWEAGKALTSLALMGPDGADALRRLHAAQAVRDPEARVILETMASNGFRIP